MPREDGLVSVLGPARADPGPLRELAVDIAVAGRIALAWLVSMVLPERWWRTLTRAIGRAVIWLRPEWKRAQLAELNRRLGAGDSGARLEILTDRIAFGHEARLHGLREYRPGSRKHRVRIVGAESVHDGLAAGNGVILWVAPFVFSSLMTKIGLEEAGFAVSHLSRTTHGFSASHRAVRWMNAVWTRVEERYVYERIVMSPTRQIAALRCLRARLADNQVVSITVGDEGVQTVTVPFLEAELRVATGPITLAATTSAPLIPVFTVREASRQFSVVLQRPLDLAIESDRHRLFTCVAEQFGRRLAPLAQQYAGQWLG